MLIFGLPHGPGLDKAILGCTAEEGDIENNSKTIAALLKNGAYGVITQDDSTAAELQEAFANEDIDQILETRTEKRILPGGRAGNTFSEATFAVNEAPVRNHLGTGVGGFSASK